VIVKFYINSQGKSTREKTMVDKQMLCPRCGGTPLQAETTTPTGEEKIKKKCMDCGTTWYDSP
jgi:ribosomal protein S27AE